MCSNVSAGGGVYYRDGRNIGRRASPHIKTTYDGHTQAIHIDNDNDDNQGRSPVPAHTGYSRQAGMSGHSPEKLRSAGQDKQGFRMGAVQVHLLPR